MSTAEADIPNWYVGSQDDRTVALAILTLNLVELGM
jgi:hypothetical protein